MKVRLANIFAKKDPSQMLDWVENRLLAKSLKYWPPVYKLSREILSRKICVTSFLKRYKVVLRKLAEWVFMHKRRPSVGFLKKVLWGISQNSQKNIGVGISFSVKLNSVDLQLHWKRVFSAGVFLWNLRNLLEHLFRRAPPDNCFWL